MQTLCGEVDIVCRHTVSFADPASFDIAERPILFNCMERLASSLGGRPSPQHSPQARTARKIQCHA